MDSSKKAQLRAEILGYLSAHPAAGDTVDGVVGWWLPRQRWIDARDEIERVLDELTAEGVLSRTELPDRRAVYAWRDRSMHEGND